MFCVMRKGIPMKPAFAILSSFVVSPDSYWVTVLPMAIGTELC